MLLILIGGLTQPGSVSTALTHSNISEEEIKHEMNVWMWMRSVEPRVDGSGPCLGLTERKQQTGTRAMSCIFIGEIICAISNELGYNLTGRAASMDCLFHCVTLSNFILFIAPRSTYNNNVWAMTEQSF